MESAFEPILLTLLALVVGAVLPAIWRFGQAMASVRDAVDRLTPEVERTAESLRALSARSEETVSQATDSIESFEETMQQVQRLAQRFEGGQSQPSGWMAMLAPLVPAVLAAIEAWRDGGTSDEPPTAAQPHPADHRHADHGANSHSPVTH